jgi:parallel beta-helix repeat protein
VHKQHLFSAVALLVAGVARADTTEVSGAVSGVWTRAGSPYAVVGEVTVPAGETLVIAPGVEVRFRGRYHFFVNGLLKSVGTETDSIVFTRDRPIEEHKWMGLRFDRCSPGCSLAWCRVEYVKNDGPYPDVRGGAVYVEACSPTISHCALCHNYSHNANANGGGGGVFVVYGGPVVEYCHIFDNYVDSGGGLCTLEDCTAIFRNNLVENNTATYCGGGMYLGVRSGPTATGNVIRHNHAGGWGGGGITLWNWYAIGPVSKTVTNNLIYANSAADAGGGIYTRYDLSYIYNNTIVGNSAGRGGGIYVLNEGQYLPDVRNAIIWGNAAGNGPSVFLDNANNSQINLNWSDVEGGWQGQGNFDSIPNFTDTVWFRLAPPSRCIDAGTSTGTPEFDFEGDARYDDPGSPNRGSGSMAYYDVGWDEFVGTGVEERKKREVRRERAGTTIVRDMLVLPVSQPSTYHSLFDPAGRVVMSLSPGANDVSRLAPGVYFVRAASRGVSAQGCYKVVLQR